MSVLVILILSSLGIAVLFLAGFVWAVKSGQFEDTCTPSLRILAEDQPSQTSLSKPATKTKVTTT